MCVGPLREERERERGTDDRAMEGQVSQDMAHICFPAGYDNGNEAFFPMSVNDLGTPSFPQDIINVSLYNCLCYHVVFFGKKKFHFILEGQVF